MKKAFIIIAMAGILAAITGCGEIDSGVDSDNNIITAKTDVSTTFSSTQLPSAEQETEKAETLAVQADTPADSKTDAISNDTASLSINPEDYLFGGYVDTQGDDLNLRNEPFPTADIIATIPNGTQLDIYACGKAGWCCTIYNGKSGYVSAEYIKEVTSYVPQEYITDISELVGQWKYQIAAENKNVDVSAIDSGTITVMENGTYTYTDLDGNTHSGTVKVDYDTFGGDYSVPFFAFYEGDQFFIGCYCHENHSDVYMTGNGGMSQIVRIK